MKNELISILKNMIRVDLHSQLQVIINHSTKEDLEGLIDLITKKGKLKLNTSDGRISSEDSMDNLLTSPTFSMITKVCIEIDFLTSKLRYFQKLPKEFKTDFGIEFELIPDLVATWREQKLEGLYD